MKKVLVTNRNGYTLDFNAAVNYMDDRICGVLHDLFDPCDKQTFFTAYEFAHEFRFGEEWELSKANPCW